MRKITLNKPRALVLGGSGFVGQNLAESSHLKGFEVLNIDIQQSPILSNHKNWSHISKDVANPKFMASILAEFKPDLLIHLAANSDIKSGQSGSNLDLKNTLNTTLALSEALRINPVGTVVFASTSAVFGEERLTGEKINTLNVPISAYGIAKLASEKILSSSYHAGHIKKLLLARFPNVVGKFMTHGLIYDLVSKYLEDPSQIEVLGDGSQEKPYILATDLLELIFRIIPDFEDQLIIEIGPNDTIKVKEIVSILQSSFPTKPDVLFGSSNAGWIGDVNKYVIDNSLLLSLLQDVKIPSSEEAIRKAIAEHLGERLKRG